VVGVAVLKKLVQVTETAKTELLWTKRKRGRRKKARKALIVD